MKKKYDSKTIAIIVTAAVLAVAAVVGAVLIIVYAMNKNKEFDYLTANLDKYITLSEDDYKNYSFSLDIAKPHKKNADGTGVSDVEVAILNMIASDIDQKADPIYKELKTAIPVTPGDTVYIWYRGYLLDDNGKELEVSGMSNFKTASSATLLQGDGLIIGSGNFVPGFELGLVGKVPAEHARFVKTTKGTVAANHVAYISYTRKAEGATKEESSECVRLDLSESDVAALWGGTLIGKTIGEKFNCELTEGGKKYSYTDVTVDFVTDFENNENVIKVECYFPYDYSLQTLRNETAYFEVYIEGVEARNPWHSDANRGSDRYDISYNWNDEYIARKVSEQGSAITAEELEEFEGDTLTAKYEKYAEKYLDDAYNEVLRSYIEDEMWNHYLKVLKVKKYPESKVNEIYNEYVADVKYQFEYSGGNIYDQSQFGEVVCETVDEFAVIYLGLQYEEKPDWKATLKEMAENLVAERLVLYYIMDKENLKPTESELASKVASLKKEYSDEYIKQYLTEYNKSRSDYNDEEWATFVAARDAELFKYYDDEYFTETAYYEIVLDTLVTYPTYTTFDDGRSAYPQTK